MAKVKHVHDDGSYVIRNLRSKPVKKLTVGSRRQVFSGKALKTSGGLQKKDLTKNAAGRVVSKKASAHGKRMAEYLPKCTMWS